VASLHERLDQARTHNQPRVVAELAATVGRLAHLSTDGYRQRLVTLEPVLRAATPLAPTPVRRALLHLGVATETDLHKLIDEGCDIDDAAAHALFARTGQVDPLVAALTRRLATGGYDLAWHLHRCLPAATRLGALAPLLRPLVDGHRLGEGIAAAHLLYRAGETGPAAPLVRAGLATRSWPAHPAARLAIELREAARQPLLRDCLTTVAALPAVEALLALGCPRREFTGILLGWMSTSDDHATIVRVCREVIDPAALSLLHELIRLDLRPDCGGEVTSTSWRDEARVDAIHAGIAALTSRQREPRAGMPPGPGRNRWAGHES
jgi:hypothetical protein